MGRLRAVWILLAVLAAWAAWDLWGPRSHSLREFDAVGVGRLETGMWKSYYARERVRLFSELAELLRTQYGFPVLRSYVAAYHAARGAAVFQVGHSRPDYEKALPAIERFYAAIRRVSVEPFDVRRAAQLELEWWIVHRERAQHPRADLDRTLGELQAELYRIPQERVAEHARLRAEAMLLRDRGGETGSPSSADWTEIERLLHASWKSLHDTVQ